MDTGKTGRLIRILRQGKGLTQAALAEGLGVSAKTVSKWECGGGAPDIGLLPRLSELLGVESGALLRGELRENAPVLGDLRRMRFYVCPDCGNLLLSLEGAEVSCCGLRLPALTPRQAEGVLMLEHSDGEWYVTARHPMTREHYVSCVAFLTGDSLFLRKLYPQWDLALRLPYVPRGRILWYDTREGLFYQEVEG